MFSLLLLPSPQLCLLFRQTTHYLIYMIYTADQDSVGIRWTAATDVDR